MSKAPKIPRTLGEVAVGAEAYVGLSWVRVFGEVAGCVWTRLVREDSSMSEPVLLAPGTQVKAVRARGAT